MPLHNNNNNVYFVHIDATEQSMYGRLSNQIVPKETAILCASSVFINHGIVAYVSAFSNYTGIGFIISSDVIVVAYRHVLHHSRICPMTHPEGTSYLRIIFFKFLPTY